MPWRHGPSLEIEGTLPCELLLYQLHQSRFRAAWEIENSCSQASHFLSPMSVHLHENISKSRAGASINDVLHPAHVRIASGADLSSSKVP